MDEYKSDPIAMAAWIAQTNARAAAMDAFIEASKRRDLQAMAMLLKKL